MQYCCFITRHELSGIFGVLLAIVGDITPSDGVPKEEKSRRERAALNEMCEVLGGGMRGLYLALSSLSLSYAYT